MNSPEQPTPSAPYTGDESILLASAKSGDGSAFCALVKPHQNNVYRFILKRINSPEDARDLTQQTLLQAHLCLATFNGTSRFSTWLIGIALNLARNHVNRAPKCHFVEYNEANISDIPRVVDAPFLDHQQKIRLGVLARAIETLPADMRECMVLLGMEGRSYEEVAQLLEVPVGTIKSKMSRARQKLREILALQGFFE